MAVINGTNGNDTLTGTAMADTILGLDGDDTLAGLGGDDVLNGGTAVGMFPAGSGWFDRADYSQATGGIVVTLIPNALQSSHSVTGGASVGSDTLINIDSVIGTNFVDTFDARNLTEDTPDPLDVIDGTFNEFEGLGGDDVIMGNGDTLISFSRATGGVMVNLALGAATGDASVGNDTFSGVNQVRGSNFADTIRGSTNGVDIDTIEIFEGFGGNDMIDGGGGLDAARYVREAPTGGLSFVLGAGGAMMVNGGAGVGTDTWINIEAVSGTDFDDIYDAGNFSGGGGATPLTNIFLGNGGNDTIIGNGATTILYVGEQFSGPPTAGVVVDLVAGTATGDASVGVDTIVGGVSGVIGSESADTIQGAATAELLEGDDGDDILHGGGGNDRLIGGDGADMMDGGFGNDVLVVDNVGDMVIEIAGGGSADRVESSITHALGAEVENLTLTGGGNINGTGNAKNNFIVGNGAANTLAGGAGSDVLVGLAGADVMDGGFGNDVFLVDDAGDMVNEIAGGGSTDRVESSITNALAAEVENLF